MRGDLPSGTVTFLFTDIEGSTRLLHALGQDAYADALAEHRRVPREAFTDHGGVEVDTQGDAFFVAFPTAVGAARAALATRDALAEGLVFVRMGLHTGTPTLTGEGYVGSDVHRGARVAALAHGGQIVLSPTTAALLGEATLRDLGLHRLKDFEAATRLWQLGDGEFPPLRTPGSVDLPSPATRFLGRERELFDAVSLVYERDPRVLTILGPGGTGKTRFAIELARLLAEDADGGTVFCALAPCARRSSWSRTSPSASVLPRAPRPRSPPACPPGARTSSVTTWSTSFLKLHVPSPRSSPQRPRYVCSQPAGRHSGSMARARSSSTCPRSSKLRPSSSFASGHGTCVRTSSRPRPCINCASASTGYRLRWSSRRRARSCSRPTRSSNASETGWNF